MKRILVLALPILTLLAFVAASASAQRLTLIRTMRGHTNEVGTVAFSPDGKTLASGSSEFEPMDGSPGEVKLWDGRTGRLKHTLNDDYNNVVSLAFSPDGKTLASGDFNDDDASEDACLWNVQTGKLRRRLTTASEPVAISPNGKVLATGGEEVGSRNGANDKPILLWSLPSVRRLHTLKPSGTLDSLAFSPNGKTLISSSGTGENDDKTAGRVQVWDMPGGKLRRTLANAGALSVAYSPDGKWRASISGSREKARVITLYDARTGQVRQTLAHHQKVYGFAFAPDSKTLVSGSGSDMDQDRPRRGQIDFWDAQTGRLIATHGLRSPVLSVAVSPDGRRLATGMGDDTVKLWRLN